MYNTVFDIYTPWRTHRRVPAHRMLWLLKVRVAGFARPPGSGRLSFSRTIGVCFAQQNANSTHQQIVEIKLSCKYKNFCPSTTVRLSCLYIQSIPDMELISSVHRSPRCPAVCSTWHYVVSCRTYVPLSLFPETLRKECWIIHFHFFKLSVLFIIIL